MVNCAASGNGLGVVALLDGHVVYFRENEPTIGGAAADYPVIDGLASLGLSEWRHSFHAGFVGNIAGYTGTVFSSTVVFPGVPTTLATSEFVTSATPPVPLPGGFIPFLFTLVATHNLRRQRAKGTEKI